MTFRTRGEHATHYIPPINWYIKQKGVILIGYKYTFKIKCTWTVTTNYFINNLFETKCSTRYIGEEGVTFSGRRDCDF